MMITGQFEKALAFAVDLHRMQLRKGSEVPYIAHLLGVCSIALENGADEDEAIAALLHDSIEDQAGCFGGADKLRGHIRSNFGEKVLEIVQGCTDAETIPKPPWRERKENYLSHLATTSASVILVSASDKLHNARAILQDLRKHGDSVWARFKGGKQGTLWYYRSLVRAFKTRGNLPLYDELERTVSAIEHLANSS
jgi:(p)ppGpp synthase/HD superfamily hydrolase